MRSKILSIFIAIFVSISIISCNKKYEGESNINDVKYKNNRNTIPSAKMDSAQAINIITKQKIQDLLDLSTLYISGNKDTEIDSVIYAQMQSYFLKTDSTQLKPLFKDLDSLKVRYASINNLNIERKITEKDTFDVAKFNVEYYNSKKAFIGSYDRNAEYVLKSMPAKDNNEFKFYFKNFYTDLNKKKDSISVQTESTQATSKEQKSQSKAEKSIKKK
ncbi:hypothetical protein SAMN05660477_02006 [Soonwooa buanensis]|uniref:Lipoprotein n=1 Tax=Soonwooa buanensis TaxID=619805 RepID=A0A1T5FEY5_9FLAO|nr:hypothetical protein [Soonwooa buanensis]SKB94731.1 hypothetical protein SAMN05660477_02006 [Soonwooa buanensis]